MLCWCPVGEGTNRTNNLGSWGSRWSWACRWSWARQAACKTWCWQCKVQNANGSAWRSKGLLMVFWQTLLCLFGQRVSSWRLLVSPLPVSIRLVSLASPLGHAFQMISRVVRAKRSSLQLYSHPCLGPSLRNLCKDHKGTLREASEKCGGKDNRVFTHYSAQTSPNPWERERQTWRRRRNSLLILPLRKVAVGRRRN